MAREKKVRVSTQEKKGLDEVREDMFGTDEVSYGVVVQRLVDAYFDDE